MLHQPTKCMVALCLTLIAIPAHTFETVAVLSGKVEVQDGDGVLFGNIEVRLQGIAAPEDSDKKRETGGPESSANLRDLVHEKLVVCHLDGTTAGKTVRPVGICYLGNRDIGQYQVETGNARDCPAFSGGRYAAAEQRAQAKGIDLSSIYKLPDYC